MNYEVGRIMKYIFLTRFVFGAGGEVGFLPSNPSRLQFASLGASVNTVDFLAVQGGGGGYFPWIFRITQEKKMNGPGSAQSLQAT